LPKEYYSSPGANHINYNYFILKCFFFPGIKLLVWNKFYFHAFVIGTERGYFHVWQSIFMKWHTIWMNYKRNCAMTSNSCSLSLPYYKFHTKNLNTIVAQIDGWRGLLIRHIFIALFTWYFIHVSTRFCFFFILFSPRLKLLLVPKIELCLIFICQVEWIEIMMNDFLKFSI
jgi:hypothetical protein